MNGYIFLWFLVIQIYTSVSSTFSYLSHKVKLEVLAIEVTSAVLKTIAAYLEVGLGQLTDAWKKIIHYNAVHFLQYPYNWTPEL